MYFTLKVYNYIDWFAIINCMGKEGAHTAKLFRSTYLTLTQFTLLGYFLFIYFSTYCKTGGGGGGERGDSIKHM